MSKSDKQKKLEGTYRDDRETGDAPLAPDGPVEMPDYLSDGAKAEWQRLASLAVQMGTLEVPDIDAFGVLCESLYQWKLAQRMLAEKGMMVETPNHYEIQSPWFTIAKQAFFQMERMFKKFGLTPADRGKLRLAAKENEPDEYENLRRQAASLDN